MMDCTSYRRSVLAAPHDPDPRLREHREICHECHLYTERLLRFESRLDRALRVDLPAPVDATVHPASLSDRVVPLRPRAHRRALPTSVYRRSWLAAAASVLLACVVAGALWLSVPRTSLAAAVVTHMAGEPDAWRRTDVPVPADALQAVLRDSHLRLTAGAGMVSYANSCSFRGHQVPHLVVQTESGPVTVMVLVHERVPESIRFDEQGYRGVIVPVAGHGSIAVLSRDPTTNPNGIGQIAVRVSDSIVWTG